MDKLDQFKTWTYVNGIRKALAERGTPEHIVDFVAAVEERRHQRGESPLPVDKLPVKQIVQQAGDCLAVAEQKILEQQAALASTAAAMTENTQLKRKLAALEKERQPSAVAKAPAVVSTCYWDPYNTGDGEY